MILDLASSVQNCLRWNGDASSMSAIERFFPVFLENALRVVAANGHPQLLESLLRLKTTNAERTRSFLARPDISQELLAPVSEKRLPNVNYLRKALAEEEAQVAAPGRWGDVPATVEKATAMINEGRGRTPNLVSTGLLLDGVCFDGQGTFRSFDFGDSTFCPNDHDRVELEGVFSALTVAVAVLKSVAPDVHHFVAQFLQFVALQKDPKINSFVTGSRFSLIGKAAFLNTNLASRGEILSGLVHEAIHACLYTAEHMSREFFLGSRIAGPSIVSPWTGRRLSSHSFLHACFVWFGLANFWRRFPISDPERAEEERFRAERGFLRMQDLGAPLIGVAPERLIKVIRSLHNEIRSCETC